MPSLAASPPRSESVGDGLELLMLPQRPSDGHPTAMSGENSHRPDPERLADTIRLRPTRTGGNVVTALPYDQIVFERTWERDGLTFASLCQVAVDCLTGFGRMPQEGDALLTWMRQRAPKWQAPSLTEMAELP